MKTFHIYDNISINSSRMRNVLDKVCSENRNTYFMFTIFSENRAVYEIMSKNMVEPEEPKVTSQYGAYALHAG